MFNFPSGPTVGQKFQPAAGMPVYGWDGEKWTTYTPDLANKATASNANPAMDGVASAGSSTAYARGDHVHPTDSSRASVLNPTFTGTLTASLLNVSGNVQVTIPGKLSSTVKGHLFGWARGTGAGGAVTPADANIKFYDHGGGSWCGVGTDGSGNFWLRTGYSGNPVPVMYIDSAQNVVFRDVTYMLTPGAGDNSTRIATTAFVKARVPTGYFPLDCSQAVTGNLVQNGDLWVHNGGNYGVLYLGNTSSRYLVWDGANYGFAGAHVYAAQGRLWGTNDFGSVPYLNARLAYVADYIPPAGLAEPYGGSTITGGTGDLGTTALNWQRRFRQFQYYTTSWFAIGYA